MSVLLSNRVSALADVALIVPLGIVLLTWLLCSEWRLALRWGGALLLGSLLVGASKLAWAIWLWNMPLIDFRVISGHAMLAAAVWPVLMSAVAASLFPGHWRSGRLAGWIICLLVAFARLFGAHTPVEVIVGLLLGFLIENDFARRVKQDSPRMRARWFVLALIVLVVYVQYGAFTNTNIWFDTLAEAIQDFRAEIRG